MRKFDEILQSIGRLREDELKKLINHTIGELVSVAERRYKRKPGAWKPLHQHKRVYAIGADTLKGKFLKYLLKHENGSQRDPKALTRYATAEKLKVSTAQISRVALPLIRSGLITRERKYFSQTAKFRDVFSLTTEGIWVAQELIEKGMVQFE